MMKHIQLIFFLFIVKLTCSGQACLHTNLSATKNFSTKIERITRANDDDSCIVTIAVTNKLTKRSIQIIKYGAVSICDAFEDCNFVKSYATNYNTNIEVRDYDFGDLIVADFNFDGREDFAAKNDCGGNGGPFYNFYIQNNKGHFSIDKYLTNTVSSFPKNINKTRKTLTTQIHANAYSECKDVYQFNSTTKTWKRIKRSFVTY